MRIAFEAPEHTFLLSDFDRWHFVLNNWFLAEDEEEDQAFESRQHSQRVVERSWKRIFDLEGGDPDYHLKPFERSYQATLWKLEWDQVREVTPFTAR